MNRQHSLHCCNVGLVGTIDPLQVRDITTNSDNDEFAPPSESGGSLDSSVDGTVSIPVTGDEIDICANHNTAIVYFGGAARDIEAFLHVNVTRVRESLIVRDERVQPNNLLAVA